MDGRTEPQRRRFVLLIEDDRGMLARVAILLSGMGCDVECAAAGPTHVRGIARMEFVVRDPGLAEGHLARRLHRLVRVLRVVELPLDAVDSRGLQVACVEASAGARGEVMELAAAFSSTVLDVAADSVTIETAGSADSLVKLADLLRPYGLRALARFPAPTMHAMR